MASEAMTAILQMEAGPSLMEPETVDERRAAVTSTLHAPLAEGTSSRHVALGGRPALWIEPDGFAATRRPIVLYLHGGVFEVGSPADYQAFCSKLALRLDAVVVALDYRLAPEYRFPAAVEDCARAYEDLLVQRDPHEIAIIGDSAGGGLTVSCLLAARRNGLPQPACAVAISAWADLTQELDAHERCKATDPFIRTEMLNRAAAQYLDGADPRDPLASPVHARSEELADLAPLLLQAAGNEVLADDSRILAQRIADAGGDVTLDLCPQAFHAWLMAGEDLPESREALEQLGLFFRANVGSER